VLLVDTSAIILKICLIASINVEVRFKPTRTKSRGFLLLLNSDCFESFFTLTVAEEEQKSMWPGYKMCRLFYNKYNISDQGSMKAVTCNTCYHWVCLMTFQDVDELACCWYNQPQATNWLQQGFQQRFQQEGRGQLVFKGGQDFLSWTSLWENFSLHGPTREAKCQILTASQFVRCLALNETLVCLFFQRLYWVSIILYIIT